jgi:hypothetical protein
VVAGYAMRKAGVTQKAGAGAVTSTAGERVPAQGKANQSHNGPVARSRDALELSKSARERAQLEGEILSLDELRTKKQEEREKSSLELKKLRWDAVYEQEKNQLELQKLQRESALDEARNEYERRKLHRDIASEEEKSDLEMRKLRDETKNARRSQYFEFCKVVVPALSIIASVVVAANSIEYQRDKDRSVDVFKQLVQFQEQITSADIKKQRNGVAAIRSLRRDAIPSLIANLDLDHKHEILMATQAAILELNEDRALQEAIMRELLTAMKHVVLRPNLAHLEYYLSLWSECLRQYKALNPGLFQQASAKVSHSLWN